MVSNDINEAIGTVSQLTGQAQEVTNVEGMVDSITGELLTSTEQAIEEGLADEITDQLNEEQLDEITQDLSSMAGSATDMLNQVEGVTNSILRQVDSTLTVAGEIALSNLDYATKLTMSAQDVLRMSFDEIEEKLKKAATEYAKQRALGIAHAEFQEQLDLYYQAKNLYDRVSGLKETALGVVDTAKGTITTTKNTVSRVKSSLTTLQKAVKVVVDLAT